IAARSFCRAHVQRYSHARAGGTLRLEAACEGAAMKSSFLIATVCILLSIAATPMAAEPPSQVQGIKRTILQRTDVPGSNYEVVMVLVEVPANTKAGRHTHPGTVVGYLLEGEYTML